MPCFACKTAEIKNNTCPNCGKFIFTETEVDLILSNSNRRTTVRISCSDRYMIIHKAKHFEKSNNGLGIIGGAVVSAVVLTAKDGKMPYGFYGLHEMQKVIFPYKNRKLKKDRAIKIIFRDGSDMILVLWRDMLPKLRDLFENQGIEIVDGTNLDHGDTYCIKPLVNDDTVGVRVCADIAPHIKMMKGNFIAPLMVPAAAPQPKAAPAPQQAPAQPPKRTVQQAAPVRPEPVTVPAKPEMIADLGLRVKTYQALMRLGVDRVEELTVCSREALLVNGISEDGIKEIEECLAVHGLALKKKQVHVRPQAPKKPEMVGDLGLDVMTFAHIFDLGISSIDMLTACSKAQLLAHGVPEDALVEVETKLAQHGFALAEDAPVVEPETIPEPVVETFSAVLEAAQEIKQQAASAPIAEAVNEPVPVAEPAPVAEPVQIPKPAPAPVVEHKREEAPAMPKRDPNVKFCRNCGAKLRRSDNFCVECGADQR